MTEIIKITLFSSVLFAFIFQMSVIIKKSRETIEKIRDSEELSFVSYLIKEDLSKSINTITIDDRVQIYGFMMSLSEEKNDSEWGIVGECRDGVASVFNLNPQGQVFVLKEDKTVETKKVIMKQKVGTKLFKVWFQDCGGLEEGKVIFSDFYRVSWYSENGKIYREVERYYEGRSAKSKFFVSKGVIETEGKKIEIRINSSSLSFEIP
ncbi:hypothetical protein HRbin19_00054 [bacterium HR19]|nr:hypothetical protein HRbin19_00054 [bacterium HR19]